MADLTEYRRRRDASRTPEPVPADGPLPHGDDNVFVVQEHHARRLHYDTRLERNGVLVSWAVPKGLLMEPGTVHLAVRTEDHPMEYAAFEGEIPHGEYGRRQGHHLGPGHVRHGEVDRRRDPGRVPRPARRRSVRVLPPAPW